MLRSMLSAGSAIRNHQTYMDVIANNIANVNTNSYKSMRVTFHELLSQVMSPGAAPQVAGRGGVNPIQVGLGMTLGGTDAIFTQGAMQSTGRPNDLAIQGNGFFIYQAGNQNLYSRDGAMDVGLDGSLVNPSTGMRVMGWPADANTGAIDSAGPMTPVMIPLNTGTAQATQNINFSGNIDSRSATTQPTSTDIQVYDSLGTQHTITVTFTKSATPANTWTWAAATADAAVTLTANNTGLTFNSNGQYQAPAATAMPSISFTFNNGAQAQTINMNYKNLNQLAQTSDLGVPVQDGFAPGQLTGFNVNPNGDVECNYSNGMRKVIAQVAIATFANPGGLLRVGDNMFAAGSNSGLASTGAPGMGGRGTIQAGYLEMANVDLAQQFTSMISAQRGFQANSRVISASDQMLQDLVNLIR